MTTGVQIFAIIMAVIVCVIGITAWYAVQIGKNKKG